MPDRLVQHHPGPPRAKNDSHFSRRRRHRTEIDERLAQRLIDLRFPVLRVEIAVIDDTAAGPRRPGLHAIVLADDDCDVEAHQRTDVGRAAAVRANDLHRLPYTAQGGHDLPDPGIAAARIGVDLGEEARLDREIDETERVVLGIKAPIRADRTRGHHPGIAAGHRSHRRRRAADRRFRELRGMGVAGGLVGNRAQPEPLGSIEAGTLDPAVVERQAFGLAVLEIELAVVHPGQ